MRFNSILKAVVIVIALIVIVYQLQKQKAAEADNESAPKLSAAAQAAAEDNYEKQNEFRRNYAANPEKPEAGYATIKPTQNR